MQEINFLKYLGQFSKEYVTLRKEDSITVIKCKYGTIQPDDIYGLRLLYVNNEESTPKYRAMVQKCKGLEIKVRQPSVFSFPIKHLKEIGEMVKISKRKQLTDLQRLELRKRANTHFHKIMA